MFNWGALSQSISSLIAIRQRNGINSGSTLEILTADPDLYIARIGSR